jgi:light-regulated signal transduction histidine kinase (bacteriophytochrome)
MNVPRLGLDKKIDIAFAVAILIFFIVSVISYHSGVELVQTLQGKDSQTLSLQAKEIILRSQQMTWFSVLVSVFGFLPIALASFAIKRDIVGRRQAEKALRRLNEELTRSNRELEQFAYVASHDLQEPLRMVASYTQLLGKRYKGKMDADADQFIDYSVEGAVRMQQLLQGLLEYSHVSRGDENFENVNCEEILKQVLEYEQRRLEETASVVTHDPLPCVVANATQWRKLFLSLIDNAIKFHGKNPPRVHVSCELKDGQWLFSVRDNGIGIEPQYFDRIFLMFQRLGARSDYPGNGFGLAFCKRIVEHHGGRIWVESELGKGSTFYFTLKKEKE